MTHEWSKYFDISSDYWKKVEKIYDENENYPKKVVKDRNLHHKFPRSFSKKDGVEIDNDENNLVSLSLSNHFLVHYYLWKCSKKGYRNLMALAFSFMRKKMVKYASEETIEQLAKDYENIMKDVYDAHRQYRHSDETKQKISEAARNRSEDYKIKMSEAKKGNKAFKGKHHSEETRKKISEANKGRVISDEWRRKMSENHKGKHWKLIYGKRVYY